MATGKSIESIWLGDILTWYLPTNYKDMPYPPCGALKAWAVDAGLREGDKVVLHHVASAGDVVSRPDGVRDRAIGIRRTTKTASMSGYMAVMVPEWAQPPTDVPSAGPTAEWLLRRGIGRVDVNDSSNGTLPDLQVGVMTIDQARVVVGNIIPLSISLQPTIGDSSTVIEEPTMEPTHTEIRVPPLDEMITRHNNEISLRGASLLLGVTTDQVEQLIDEGALVARRVGDTWLVDAASVTKLYRTPTGDRLVYAVVLEPHPRDGSGDALDPIDAAPIPEQSGIAITNERLVESTTPLPSQNECPNAAAALDNANERLHGDIARLNNETSTLRQCFGRLQGVIEAKTGVDVSEYMGDLVALTKALIVALTQSCKPVLDASVIDAIHAEKATHVTKQAISSKSEVRHRPIIGDNEVVAVSTDANTGVKKAVFVGDQLFDRAKAAGDDLKDLLHEMEKPSIGTALLAQEPNFFYDDVNKNHQEPG